LITSSEVTLLFVAASNTMISTSGSIVGIHWAITCLPFRFLPQELGDDSIQVIVGPQLEHFIHVYYPYLG